MRNMLRKLTRLNITTIRAYHKPPAVGRVVREEVAILPHTRPERRKIQAELDFDKVQFSKAISQYYGQIGRLIGFNPVRRAEDEKIMIDESARELAEASLDENGLLAALSDVEDVENVALAQFSDEEVDVVV
ncbi:hypothetical protein GPALN_002234 [Globodera pallida]|nr:hypothetical protein GPALN_002234 [Globodera pallida]